VSIKIKHFAALLFACYLPLSFDKAGVVLSSWSNKSFHPMDDCFGGWT